MYNPLGAVSLMSHGCGLEGTMLPGSWVEGCAACAVCCVMCHVHNRSRLQLEGLQQAPVGDSTVHLSSIVYNSPDGGAQILLGVV